MGVHINRPGDDFDLERERLGDIYPGWVRALGIRPSLDPWNDRPMFRGDTRRDERDRGSKSEEAA